MPHLYSTFPEIAMSDAFDDTTRLTPVGEEIARLQAEIEKLYSPARINLNGVDLGDALEAFAIALGRYKRKLKAQEFSEVTAEKWTEQFALVGQNYLLHLNNHRVWVGPRADQVTDETVTS